MNNQPESDPQIEQYLQMLDDCLSVMPLEDRQAVRDEICVHLHAMVASYQNKGMEHSHAVERALTRFGSPKKIGKQLARRWRQEHQANKSLFLSRLARMSPSTIYTLYVPGMEIAFAQWNPAIALLLGCVGGMAIQSLTVLGDRTQSNSHYAKKNSGFALIMILIKYVSLLYAKQTNGPQFPFSAKYILRSETELVFWIGVCSGCLLPLLIRPLRRALQRQS